MKPLLLAGLLVAIAAPAAAQVCSVKQLKIWTGTSCHVESLEKLTPAEVAALPRGVKPSS